VTETELCSYFN